MKLTLFSLSTVLRAIITIIITFIMAILETKVMNCIQKRFSTKMRLSVLILCSSIFMLASIVYGNCMKQNLQETIQSSENKEKLNNEEGKEKYTDRLYVPTMIEKIDNTYFIVDCWNHRVIYSDSLKSDINNWKQLTDEEYIGGHTVCTDGKIIVLDNTDNSQLLVYTKAQDGYKKIQTINNIMGRPHYVIYDSVNQYFYVIASTEGKIYVYRNNDLHLELVREDTIEEIVGSYVRSISIIDGYLYTVSGPGNIYRYEITTTGFKLAEAYPVPPELSGMNQITKIGAYYYLTINTGANGSVDETTIVRTKDLHTLCEYSYEDLYKTFGFVGQPYYLTQFDGAYYITEISENCGNGIKKFNVNNDSIENIENVFYWEEVHENAKEHFQYVESLSNTKEIVDLFLFAGQSNMSGKGNATEAPTVLKGYEFRSISDTSHLYPISEPFGVNENKKNGINDTWENMTVLRKTGSMVSAFANSYYRITGTPIVGVSCSEGATTISQWLPGTERYNDLVSRAQSAKDFLNTSNEYLLRNVYLVWCQGESDGDIGTSSDDYYNSLKMLTSSLMENDIVDSCFIIAIGENGSNKDVYRTIHDTQLKYCNENDSCTLISDSFLGMKEKGMMIDDYHYSQKGYNIVGDEAGKNAACCSLK